MAKLECVLGKETMDEIGRLNIMLESNTNDELAVLLRRKIAELTKRISAVTFTRIDDAIVIEEWRDERGEIHREDGPAVVRYTLYGTIEMVGYCVGGKCHRTDGPAIINYRNDGSVILEEWYYNDKFHRVGAPARIKYWDADYGPVGGVEWEMWYMDGEKCNFSKVTYFPNGHVRSVVA